MPGPLEQYCKRIVKDVGAYKLRDALPVYLARELSGCNGVGRVADGLRHLDRYVIGCEAWRIVLEETKYLVVHPAVAMAWAGCALQE